jgi:hypothetical protein
MISLAQDARAWTLFEADAQEELSFAWIIAKQARVYHWTAEEAAAVPTLQVSASA